MVTVPVIAAFTHEGRAYRAGEAITIAPVVAAILHRRGVVSLTRGTAQAVQAPVAEQAPTTRRRRTYRRRDLVAE
jgi:hypothetical protein